MMEAPSERHARAPVDGRPAANTPVGPDIETSSEGYARRFSGRSGAYFLAIQERIALDLLAAYPAARVLDVGGGHAQLAGPLVRAGFDVTVAGSAESCRERLDRELAPGSFAYRTVDLVRLPFADRAFDVVVSFRLIPHVDEWERLVAELCRVARLAVVVDYPDKRSFNCVYRLLFAAKKALEGNTRPFLLFTRREIARAFTASGFGRLVFRPEFFAPMVVHRVARSRAISAGMEAFFSAIGLTRLFGSPIIVRAERLDGAPAGREGGR